MLFDLKFYERDGAAVVQTRYDWVADDVNPYNIHTVHLEDGERVIGYKSRTVPNTINSAYQLDFQLIVGRLV